MLLSYNLRLYSLYYISNLVHARTAFLVVGNHGQLAECLAYASHCAGETGNFLLTGNLRLYKCSIRAAGAWIDYLWFWTEPWTATLYFLPSDLHGSLQAPAYSPRCMTVEPVPVPLLSAPETNSPVSG